MRTDPVATVLNSCVGCGVCGTNAHTAALCPSFYRTDVIQNPNKKDEILAKVRKGFTKLASRGIERRAARFEAAGVA
jgi:indolepyruvate ferredoxin oxidoreductase alpha subunit